MLRKKHTKSNKYKHEHSMKQFNRANKTLVIINNLRDVTEYYNHNKQIVFCITTGKAVETWYSLVIKVLGFGSNGTTNQFADHEDEVSELTEP
ncbi:Speckle-Type Poz Protein [Manis pentadactyla]|nr:Speckle-Type Poz Protein [Manis pentadactyla]